jgi:hypothetical protein
MTLSPQVKASFTRGLKLVVAAAIPIVVGTLLDVSTQYTGSTAALFVLGARVLEGYGDQKREAKGQVLDSDVGAYLPPKGSAPLGALRRSRFRDTTDSIAFGQEDDGDFLEVEEDVTPDPLGRSVTTGLPGIKVTTDERIPPGIGIITGIANPSPIGDSTYVRFPNPTITT